MDKIKLNRVFKQIKKEAHMDYVVTNADEYGDCNSCVNAELGIEFGIESKGIWAKHWLHGMNKGGAWKDLDELYIAHDITEDQAKILVKILEDNGYSVEPKQYNPMKCFCIKEI